MLFSRVATPIVLLLSLGATVFARPSADGALAKRATEAQVEAILADLDATTNTIVPEISKPQSCCAFSVFLMFKLEQPLLPQAERLLTLLSFLSWRSCSVPLTMLLPP